MLGAENSMERVVNRRVVIDDQHAPIGERGVIEHPISPCTGAGGFAATVASGGTCVAAER